MSFRAFCLVGEVDMTVLVPIQYWSRISVMFIALVRAQRAENNVLKREGCFCTVIPIDHLYKDSMTRNTYSQGSANIPIGQRFGAVIAAH
jgi:hypothetical protein